MSSNDVLTRAQQKIAQINNKYIGDMQALAQVLEANVKDFKTMVAISQAATETELEQERVGAVILQTEYREFLPFVVSEMRLRRTAFSDWFMSKTPLALEHSLPNLQKEIVCLALQKFIVTAEIGDILAAALKSTRELNARLEDENNFDTQHRKMMALAKELMTELAKQIVVNPKFANSIKICDPDDGGCSCGHDFGRSGFPQDSDDERDVNNAEDRELKAFIEEKELQSSDSIVRRPPTDGESPPKSTRAKKRKMIK